MPNTKSQPAERPCGLGRRLLIMTYDAVVVTALLLLATTAALPLGFMGNQALRDPFFTLYLASVWFFYDALCWRMGGMTLGMRAWGVRLVTGHGSVLSWRACLLRFLVSLVSALALGAGFLWSLADPARRAWHDRASDSRLLRVTQEPD